MFLLVQGESTRSCIPAFFSPFRPSPLRIQLTGVFRHPSLTKHHPTFTTDASASASPPTTSLSAPTGITPTSQHQTLNNPIPIPNPYPFPSHPLANPFPSHTARRPRRASLCKWQAVPAHSLRLQPVANSHLISRQFTHGTLDARLASAQGRVLLLSHTRTCLTTLCYATYELPPDIDMDMDMSIPAARGIISMARYPGPCDWG